MELTQRGEWYQGHSDFDWQHESGKYEHTQKYLTCITSCYTQKIYNAYKWKQNFSKTKM